MEPCVGMRQRSASARVAAKSLLMPSLLAYLYANCRTFLVVIARQPIFTVVP